MEITITQSESVTGLVEVVGITKRVEVMVHTGDADDVQGCSTSPVTDSDCVIVIWLKLTISPLDATQESHASLCLSPHQEPLPNLLEQELQRVGLHRL
jgi:hypothetical protein